MAVLHDGRGEWNNNGAALLAWFDTPQASLYLLSEIEEPRKTTRPERGSRTGELSPGNADSYKRVGEYLSAQRSYVVFFL